MDRDTIIAQLQAAGVDTSAVTDAMPTEFLQAMLQALLAAKGQAPAPNGGSAAAGTVPAGPVSFSEQAVVGILAKSLPGMLASALAPITQTIQGLAGQVQANNRASERQQIEAFCEQNKAKIFPFEMDPKLGGGRTLVDRLLDLSNNPQQAVSFAEPNGQTVSLTPRQQEMRAIAMRPNLPISFSEGISAEERGRQVAGAGYSPAGARATRPGDVTPERREELLKATPMGRAILARQTPSKN